MGVKWFALFFLAFSFLAIGWVMWTPKMETVNEKIDIPKICEAVRHAEGVRSRYPYGIKSVKCEGINACRICCLRTIRHYYRDFIKTHRFTVKEFVRYASRRYDSDDTRDVQEGWSKRVMWFYKKQGG